MLDFMGLVIPLGEDVHRVLFGVFLNFVTGRFFVAMVNSCNRSTMACRTCMKKEEKDVS